MNDPGPAGLRTLVTFDAPEDTAPIEGDVPGKPLAERIFGDLQSRGIECESLDLHETYAWSWRSSLEGAQFYVVLGFRDDESGRWLLNFTPRFKVKAWFARNRYRQGETRLASANVGDRGKHYRVSCGRVCDHLPHVTSTGCRVVKAALTWSTCARRQRGRRREAE
jgi:hypothetical protein